MFKVRIPEFSVEELDQLEEFFKKKKNKNQWGWGWGWEIVGKWWYVICYIVYRYEYECISRDIARYLNILLI
jgi:hypothetical protein